MLLQLDPPYGVRNKPRYHLYSTITSCREFVLTELRKPPVVPVVV
jgi:hypothetical protein